MQQQTFTPDKIISGGQTGADLGGLVGAEKADIATGGTAPRDYKTEKGPQPEILRDRFGLKMDNSPNYAQRTRINVNDADATVIFSSNADSKGTLATIKFCQQLNRPYLLVDPFLGNSQKLVFDFIQQNKPVTLNIAGNRESVSPGIARRVATIVSTALGIKAAPEQQHTP